MLIAACIASPRNALYSVPDIVHLHHQLPWIWLELFDHSSLGHRELDILYRMHDYTDAHYATEAEHMLEDLRVLRLKHVWQKATAEADQLIRKRRAGQSQIYERCTSRKTLPGPEEDGQTSHQDKRLRRLPSGVG